MNKRALSQTEGREVVEQLDGSVTEYSYFAPSEENMDRLVKELFEGHWREITVGPCIEGAGFEARFSEKPKLSMLDGDLTGGLRPRPFYPFIAVDKSKPSSHPCQKLQGARVALFEQRGAGCGGGRSWGLRLWNGFGEQMTTIFLPNPRLSDDLKILERPDWQRLSLWYELRHQFLCEEPPADIGEAQAARG